MFKRVMFVATLLFGLLPLQAQVDSRLITSTDLLDVYKSTPAKPEILTVFDFSNSMYAMYFHSKYYPAITGDVHLKTAPNGTGFQNALPGLAQRDDGIRNPQWNIGIVPVISNYGKVYMVPGWGSNTSWGNNSTPMDTNDNQYTSGTIKNALNYMDNSGTGRLVAPDGSLVAISGSTYSQSALATLVQKASHIRMTATANGVTRTIDLPIAWAILDTTSSNVNPVVQTIPDPLGNGGAGGPAITPDEAYLDSGNIVCDSNTSFYKLGLSRWNDDYLWWVFFGQDAKTADGTTSSNTGNYIIPAVTTPTAASPWTNGLPVMMRYQALKYCVVKTWLNNQNKVWWGFRYLDGTEQNTMNVSPDNGNASSTAVTRDLRLFRPAQNSSSVDPKLKNFVGVLPATGTPLTYAFANAYYQLALNKDASSTFGTSSGGGQSGTENPIPACRTSFVVVFTDGVANDTVSTNNSAIGTGSDVYSQGNAAIANTNLGTLTTALAPGTSHRFNIWTLAAVAAHYPAGSYVSPTSATSSTAVGSAAPFLISDRGATISNKRRIRTMTVGMSLFGNLTDAGGGKSSLYRAALYGNPNVSTWVDPTSANPTPAFDPADSTRNDRNVNPFFFDAGSIDQLSASMDAVVAEAITASGSVSAPSAPLVGLSLGREAFLGLFQPASSGPRWRGDLLAAGLQISSSGDTFLGNDGAAVSSVNSENAIWSAGDLLQSEGYTYNFQAAQYTDPTTITGTGPRSWKLGKRKVLTNVSGNSLIDLDETTIAAASTVGASSDADRVAFLRFLRGAHASAESNLITVSAAPSINRIDIMGDIISSSPVVLNYPLSLAATSPVLSAVNTTTWNEMTFRVIFVADNQGYIHAFGELGGILYTGTAPNIVKTPIAAVDELWAFFPGELLAGMPAYIRNIAKTHIYGVDGPPVIYFNDRPASNQVVGDGLVNGTDIVRVVFGMGKGGRNYYSFDVKDPYNPILAWKLLPDTSADAVVQKMGLATSTPALARVLVGGTSTDVLFIGGGLSTKVVDAAMGSLGRNMVALDVQTGAVLKTWNYSAIANMGSLSAPVVPVEFLPNTGMAQRVYFVDQPIEGASLGTGTRGSAIWAMGQTALASNGVIRLDSSDINNWTGGGFAVGGLRKVYQCAAGQILSTSPVPFRLSSPYPIARTVVPLVSPAVMGLAFNSGDRNDPLDRDLINPSGQNQVMVVFDRQDSANMSGLTPLPTNSSTMDTNGFTDADLYDLTTVATTTDAKLIPSNTSYYLKTKFGYKLLMGATAAKSVSDAGGPNYYPKAPNSPAISSNVLYFSDLTPGNVVDANGNAVACTGTGQTVIYRMCDVMAPVFHSGTTAADLTTFNQSASNCSGFTLTFANIPGPLTGLGSVGVLVSGQGKTSTGVAGGISTAGAEAQVIPGKTQNFGFRVKTWRIVR